MGTDCRCGHAEREHKWEAAECGHHLCPCNKYDPAATAKEMANGLQLALDTTPAHSPYAWVNPDGLREVIAFLRTLGDT